MLTTALSTPSWGSLLPVCGEGRVMAHTARLRFDGTALPFAGLQLVDVFTRPRGAPV